MRLLSVIFNGTLLQSEFENFSPSTSMTKRIQQIYILVSSSFFCSILFVSNKFLYHDDMSPVWQQQLVWWVVTMTDSFLFITDHFIHLLATTILQTTTTTTTTTLPPPYNVPTMSSDPSPLPPQQQPQPQPQPPIARDVILKLHILVNKCQYLWPSLMGPHLHVPY